MQDLTLVGLTGDSTKFVLVSDSGEEYALPADAKLRSAIRGDHARLGQLEIQMESAIRPRDIQARIRAGETPETVAAAAQTTVERIMGYASPVLAERAHIADCAQRSSVRRKAGEGPARLLGDAVEERLRGRNTDPGTVEWDAWRREDGRWTLVADYRSGERSRRAVFLYDVPGRYVVAQDDEARWLVGEQGTRTSPQPRSGGNQRRLSAVSMEDELPLGADAIDMVTDPADTTEPTGEPAAPAPPQPVHEVAAAAEEHTVHRSDATTAARGRVPAEADPAAETGDADWIATQSTERPVREEHEEAAKQAPAKRAAKKTRGRASVPSWDEIMFGGGKSE